MRSTRLTVPNGFQQGRKEYPVYFTFLIPNFGFLLVNTPQILVLGEGTGVSVVGTGRRATEMELGRQTRIDRAESVDTVGRGTV